MLLYTYFINYLLLGRLLNQFDCPLKQPVYYPVNIISQKPIKEMPSNFGHIMYYGSYRPNYRLQITHFVIKRSKVKVTAWKGQKNRVNSNYLSLFHQNNVTFMYLDLRHAD